MELKNKYLKITLNILILMFWLFVLIVALPKIVVFFMPFFIGWIIALISNPLVRFLEKHVKIVRKHGSMLIIVLALTLVIGGGYFGISRLYQEVISLSQSMPEIITSVSQDIVKISYNLKGVYKLLPLEIQLSISDMGSNGMETFTDMVSGIGGPTVSAAGRFAKNLPSTFINIIITLLAAYFFIVEKDNISKTIRKFLSPDLIATWDDIIGRLKFLVGGYFKAQFKIMGVVAAILFIGFLILRVRYAFLFALMIALLDFLPFFGTGAVLIPWSIFKFLTGNYSVGIGLLVIYVTSQVIRQIIQPKILGDTIGLNPLATLFFMFIGFKLGSVFGLILAVPVGMIIINLLEEGYFNRYIDIVQEIIKDINKYRKI